MQIRSATEADIPSIVALLKISLGESLMPKSEGYWRWKHINNPFGASPVLLCWEEGMLLGVRAFMRWEWTFEGKIYPAVRAVDTATHPQHQGKGIFKKLTLSLVDMCKERGDLFVFNTPNAQSKPGYLKMGWMESGKLPITIGFIRPLQIVKHALKGGDKTPKQFDIDSPLNYYLEHPTLSLLINGSREVSHVNTNVSVHYLKWRYRDVPVAQYVALGEEEENSLTALIFGRIKQSRLGLELRITDFFLKNRHAGVALLDKLEERKKAWRIDFCTISGIERNGRNLTGKYHWKSSAGPTVTIRPLRLEDLSILQNFRKWTPSLGDLELF